MAKKKIGIQKAHLTEEKFKKEIFRSVEKLLWLVGKLGVGFDVRER